MAKRIVLESYSFDKVSKIVTINNRYLRREQLILITNIDKNTVIYNFADTTFSIDTWETSATPNAEYTKITLKNTGNPLAFDNMSNNDKLSILIEETNESFQPAEAQLDPVGKIRMSTPQSLIDTDFEYGVQPTKWETLSLINNKPSMFFDSTLPIPITAITTAGTRTVTVSFASASVTAATIAGNVLTITGTLTGTIFPGMIVTGGTTFANTFIVAQGAVNNTWIVSVGGTVASAALSFNVPAATTLQPYYLQDSTSTVANGWIYPIGPTTAGFTFTARETIPTGNIYDPSKTYLYQGSSYSNNGILVASTGFAGTGTAMTVTTAFPHGLTVGSGIYVTNVSTGTANAANGAWMVRQVLSACSFVYDCFTAVSSTNAYTIPGTGLTVTGIVGNGTTTGPSGVGVSVAISVAGTGYLVGDVHTVSLASGTGLRVKIMAIYPGGIVRDIQLFDGGTGYAAGAFTATATTPTGGFSANLLMPRTWGSSVHRPFDGGVQFTAGLPYHNNQLIRQTRRYFRYQSGKGIQFATGSNLCSPLLVESVVATGSSTATVTVTTKFSHNLGVGAAILVSGIDNVAAFNGTGVSGGSTYVITAITENTFTYSASATFASATTAVGMNINIQPIKWYGSNIRIGLFDQQNGFFFQYDGQTVSAVRRSSTTQLRGYISTLYCGNQIVTGVLTKWSEQLAINEQVVIRGQSYTVVSIQSDTQMTIYPEYRGVAIVDPARVIVSKTIDTKINQSSWNIDKCDGTGVSGFNLDVGKMQMWMIDYAWYGAGAIRWGFKNQRGEVMYVHRLAHGNLLTEAYMRSGNLPARYEVNTFPLITRLTASVASNALTIPVVSTVGWPSSGVIAITQSGFTTSALVEYITYTSKTDTSFILSSTGNRAQQALTGPGALATAGGNTATTFTYSATAPISVALYSPQVATSISHWGSAVIMDGRYDDDKSFVFVAGMQQNLTAIPVGVTQPLMSIRISPSVDSGLSGVLGQREIINRMQLVLRSVGILSGSNATLLVTLRLNGNIVSGNGATTANYTTTPFGPAPFQSLGGSSLAQVSYHYLNHSIIGGETLFAFWANPAANTVTAQDLSNVRDIGNSILGGATTLQHPTTNLNKFPDGPDIITICVTNAGTSPSGTVNARISWTEAQA
jgi:hypothetical protein